MRKKRILFHSDAAYAPTGFGGALKRLMSYLWKTGRYEIANYAGGVAWIGDNNAKRFPWKTYGAIPNHRPDIIQRMNQDPNYARQVSYGEAMLDEVINDFRPDIYIMQQDWWAAPYVFSRKWWNKISCVFHWTADSLPLLDDAVNNAEKLQHHYVWSKFAEKEFHRLAKDLESKIDKAPLEQRPQIQAKVDGFNRVKTIYASVDDKYFYPMSYAEKLNLRHKYGFDEDTFIISTLSRSQLRKLFPTQIEAFAIFRRNNPKVKAKLIHWTGLEEGWNIQKSCIEHGVDIKDVLAAFRCRETGEIFYLPAVAGEKDNPKTGRKNSLKSTGIDNPAPEEMINEFYNLSDVFTLNITSGGAELGALQAKFCGLPTILNAYSCFEDLAGIENGTLNVEEAFGYEIGSNFRKAQPIPASIAKRFEEVYKMSRQERQKIGANGRKLGLERYSVSAVGKQFEELIDSLPFTEYDFAPQESGDERLRNPAAPMPQNADNAEFVTQLYKTILTREPDQGGFQNWLAALQNGAKREDVYNFFRKVATEENSKLGKTQLDLVLGPEPPENRVLLAIPGSLGDLINISSLFKDARELYKDKTIYFACNPEFMDIPRCSEGLYIDKVIPFLPEMHQPPILEGAMGAEKKFQIVIHLGAQTQNFLNYYRGGVDKSKIELEYK